MENSEQITPQPSAEEQVNQQIAVEETPLGGYEALLKREEDRETGKEAISVQEQQTVLEGLLSDDAKQMQVEEAKVTANDATEESSMPSLEEISAMKLIEPTLDGEAIQDLPDVTSLPPSLPPDQLSQVGEDKKQEYQKKFSMNSMLDIFSFPKLALNLYFSQTENDFYKPGQDNGTRVEQAIQAAYDTFAPSAESYEGQTMNRADQLLKPLMAPAAANIQGIIGALTAEEGKAFEGYAESAKKAWEETLDRPYGEEVPFNGLMLMEQISPNAHPAAKFAGGMLAEIFLDPTVILGPGIVRIFQKGVSKLNEVGGATRVMQTGIKDVADALIKKGTPLGTEANTNLAKLARAVDDAPDNIQRKKRLQALEKEMNKNPEVIQAIKQDAEDELIQRAAVYKSVLGDPNNPASSVKPRDPFNTSVDPLEEALSVNNGSVSPLDIEINLSSNNPNQADELLSQIQKLVAKETTETVKSKSHAETLKLARQRDLSTLIGKPATDFNSVDAAAMMLGIEATGKKLSQITRLYKADPSPQNLEAWDRAYDLYGTLLSKARGASSEFGRGLEIQKIINTIPNSQKGKQISALVEAGADEGVKIGELSDAKLYLMEAIAKTNDPYLVSQAVQKIPLVGKIAAGAMEALHNFAISGPETFLTAIIGNTNTLFMNPTRSIINGMSYSAVGEWRQASTAFMDVGAQLQGLMVGFGKNLKLAFTKTEWNELDLPSKLASKNEVQNVNLAHRISSNYMGVDPENLFGKALDVFGSGTRSFGEAMGKIDKTSRVLTYESNIASQAWKTARAASADPDTVAQMYATLKKNPTDQMKRNAIDLSAENAFMNDLAPKAGAGALENNFLRGAGFLEQGLKRLPTAPFTMFFRTSTNIAIWGTKNSSIGDFWRGFQGQLWSSNKRTRDYAQAQMAIGSLIPAYMISTFGENIEGHIDYSSPEGRLKKRLGIDEYSITTKGGTTYKFGDIPALRISLGLWINTRNAMNSMRAEGLTDEAPNPYYQDLLSATTAATVQSLTDSSFLGQVGAISNMVEGLSSGNEEYAKKQWFRMLATMTVPTLISQTNQQFLDNTLRESETLTQAIQARLPIVSSWLEPKVTPYGDDEVKSDAVNMPFMNRFISTHSQPDAYDEEIMALGVNVDKPAEFLETSYKGVPLKVKLNLEQRTALARTIGKGFPMGAAPIKEQFMGFMDSAEYRSPLANERYKKENLQAIWNDQKNAAKDWLVKNDEELKQAIEEEFERIKEEDIQSTFRNRPLGEQL